MAAGPGKNLKTSETKAIPGVVKTSVLFSEEGSKGKTKAFKNS